MLEEIPWVKTCSMGIWVGSGSRFETPESAGASHFIEHMLFKGTETKSAYDIAMQMDEIGGTLNAYTTKEYTCFYVRSLTEHVSLAFDILCDMLTSPRMDKSDIETERGVILEELAMYEDSPEDLCSDLLYDGVWGSDMIGKNILGTRQSLSDTNENTLRLHMEKYYVPERTVISFCGKFDRDCVLEMCEKYFGAMKGTDNPIVGSVPEYRKSIITCKKPFEQNQLALIFPGVSAQDENKTAVSLACTILGGSTSSRLFQKLREQLGLVYSVDAFNVPYLGGGLVGITMGLSKKSEATALRETMKILSSLPEEISEEELRRVQEQSISLFIMGLESTSARAARTAQNELLLNSVEDEDSVIKRVRSVTTSQLSSAASSLFNPDNLSLCCVGKVHDEDFYKETLNIR